MKIACLFRQGYDFLTASVIEGLDSLGYDLYCPNHSNNAPMRSVVNDMTEACSKADLVLFFTGDPDFDARFKIAMLTPDKVAFIDGRDASSLHNCGFFFKGGYFKRELPLNSQREGVYPLPFAAEKVYFNNMPEGRRKDIDISSTLRAEPWAGQGGVWRGYINKVLEGDNPHVARPKVDVMYIGTPSEGGPGVPSNHEKKKAYYEILARSRISISYYGNSGACDTGRFWEILASKALLFSPPMLIKMPSPFVPNEHFIQFEDLQELKSKLQMYNDNEAERYVIAQAGYEHLLKYHTSKARAEYMIKIIKERLNAPRD